MRRKFLFYIVAVLIIIGMQSLNSQEIFEIIKEGEVSDIKKIFEKKPGVINFINERGVSTLHIAAENGKLEIAQFLIKKGLDKDIKDINKTTPLIYAARSGKIEILKFFLSLDVNINQQTQSGRTALHWAGTNNHKDVLEILFKKGAKTELRDQWERTPLLATLLKNGDVQTFKLFVKYGANLEAKSKRNTVINRAAMGKFNKIVKLLIEKKVKIDKKDTRLLYLSINNGLYELFKVFEKMGIDYKSFKEKKWPLLQYAANGGSPEIVKSILTKGFEINKQNKYGWTPLHTAIYYGHKQAVKMLLEKGADINKKTFGGKTAYIIAQKNGYNGIASLLISHKANTEDYKLSLEKSLYLGQKPPGIETKLFAPDIVSTHRGESNSLTFSPDGREIFWDSYFGKRFGSRIVHSKIKNDQWTVPQFASFSCEYKFSESTPFFSPDGNKLFFISRRPKNSKEKGGKENIWFIKKNSQGWSEPEPVSDLINSKTPHMQFSVSGNGTMFFNSKDGGGKGKSDIYSSKFKNGHYQKPVNLGDSINTEHTELTPFIAPDESYLMFSRVGQSDGFGAMDIYISFKNKDGSWTEAVNMKKGINSNAWDSCPMVSPDGKFLFFNSNSDIYWVSANIIDDLRLEVFKKEKNSKK